jgi:hypothetical protein
MTVFLLLTMPLFAQDTPVGPAGAEVATQATPVAATLSETAEYNVQETVELHRMDPRHFGSSEFPIEYPCDRMLA